jgi:hypothetical protein
MAADVARQPAPSGAAEAATDFLRHSHQRVGERHQPQQGEACLRASLRIGGNPARIIVGGASDQPRSEDAEQTRLRWTDDWIKAINRMAHNPGGRPRFPVKGRPMRERHHKSRTCQGTSNGRQGLSGYMH